MNKIIPIIIVSLFISSLAFAGEYKMRYNPHTHKLDWVRSDTRIATATLFDPDSMQGTSDFIPLIAIESEKYPNGITITDVGIKTDQSSSYSVVFEEWTDPTTQANDLETVATSTSTEAEDDGTIGNGSGGSAGDCNVGSIIGVDLPTTDINWLEVWIVFTINSS